MPTHTALSFLQAMITRGASGTAASKELQKLSQLSLRTKGKHECAVCMLLCDHINEICCSKNGGIFFN